MSPSKSPLPSCLKYDANWELYLSQKTSQTTSPASSAEFVSIGKRYVRSSLDHPRHIYNNMSSRTVPKTYTIPHEVHEDDEDKDDGIFTTLFDVTKLVYPWDHPRREKRLEKRKFEKVVGKLLKPISLLVAKIEENKTVGFARLRR